MFLIPEYEPHFLSTVEEVLDLHGKRLRELIGKPLNSVWLVFFTDMDEWYPDMPVVFQVGSSQLEFCAWKLNELSLTWNTLSLTQPLDDFVHWDENNNELREPLEWRLNAHPALAQSIGKIITGIEVTEYLLRLTIPPGTITKNWILNGLDFSLQDGYLSVFNALDENGLTAVREVQGFRRTPV